MCVGFKVTILQIGSAFILDIENIIIRPNIVTEQIYSRWPFKCYNIGLNAFFVEI